MKALINTTFILLNETILLFILLSITAIGKSQSQLNFYNFNTQNGFPGGEIYDIYQDQNGLMWFATDRGICNYDGHNFNNLMTDEGLTSSTIFNFFPMKNEDVWCTTYNNKFFYFNQNDYKIKQYVFNDTLQKYAINGVPNSFMLAQDSTIHVGFSDRIGILSIDKNGNVISTPYLFGAQDSLLVVNQTDSNDHLLFHYKKEGLGNSYLDKNEKAFKLPIANFNKSFVNKGNHLIIDHFHAYLFRENYPPVIIESENIVIGAGFYTDTLIWVGSKNTGVVLYNLDGVPQDTLIREKDVTDIFQDHNNGIWLSTAYSGIFYCQNKSIKSYQMPSTSGIYDLGIDQNGNLLIGMQNGDLYERTNGRIRLLLKSNYQIPSLSEYSSELSSVIKIVGKTIILGEDSLKSLLPICGIAEGLDKLPIFFSREAIFVYNENGTITPYSIYHTIFDVQAFNNKIYFGSNDGIYTYDTLSLEAKRFIDNSKFRFRVSDIDRFRKNNIILGSLEKGLFILTEKGIHSINKQTGLTSDFVTEIYVEDDTSIWVGTNSGLNLLTFKNGEYKIDKITKFDGLIDNDITDVKVIGDTVWVATKSGLNSFNKNFIKKNKIRTNHFVQILSAEVDGTEIANDSKLTNDHKAIEFTFHGTSFRRGAILQFRYRLNGYDQNWNYTTGHKAIYAQLPSGEYELIVQASTDNQWSSAARSIRFHIIPPFYRKIEFILFALVVGLILTYFFFKYRLFVYHRDLMRELLRHLLKRLRKKTTTFVVRENGQNIKIDSNDIIYVQASRNYIEIHTENGSIVVREKISNFLKIVPDPIEYLRIRRSCIVRIDKITANSKNTVTLNSIQIKVGNTYLKSLSQLQI